MRQMRFTAVSLLTIAIAAQLGTSVSRAADQTPAKAEDLTPAASSQDFKVICGNLRNKAEGGEGLTPEEKTTYVKCLQINQDFNEYPGLFRPIEARREDDYRVFKPKEDNEVIKKIIENADPLPNTNHLDAM